MLPKVRATYLRHRLGWAGFSLRRAGLAESRVSGKLRITDEGRKFLATNPTRLRAPDLKKFPSYAALVDRIKSATETVEGKAANSSEAPHETPEERI